MAPHGPPWPLIPGQLSAANVDEKHKVSKKKKKGRNRRSHSCCWKRERGQAQSLTATTTTTTTTTTSFIILLQNSARAAGRPAVCSVSLSWHACRFIYVFIYLFQHLFIHLFMHLFIYLFILKSCLVLHSRLVLQVKPSTCSEQRAGLGGSEGVVAGRDADQERVFRRVLQTEISQISGGLGHLHQQERLGVWLIVWLAGN